MNTLPSATVILCYGDSNTYGLKPDRGGRYDAATRWTGVLQNTLGTNCYIIEEGLGGRTTDLEHPNPNKPSRNGLTYFKACLESHSAVDIVIIMLGTNDFKVPYDRTVEDITTAIEGYVDHIEATYRDRASKPVVILVSPPYVNDSAAEFYDSMPTPGIYDQSSAKKSHHLANNLRNLAQTKHIHFVDSAVITEAGEDGIHITEYAHKALGSELARLIIREIGQ